MMSKWVHRLSTGGKFHKKNSWVICFSLPCITPADAAHSNVGLYQVALKHQNKIMKIDFRGLSWCQEPKGCADKHRFMHSHNTPNDHFILHLFPNLDATTLVLRKSPSSIDL
mmetsp:Transcript_26758/g.54760  ORF Transcript_26758/g.54760 Transcript_26758/m.54760 type:complete len:112 (+) Transcript_26758:171-506(+)